MPSRPGVPGAIALTKVTDVDTWIRVEAQFDDMMKAKHEDLLLFDAKCRDSIKPSGEKRHAVFTKDDLLKRFVPWKFAKGKARPMLWKTLRGNSDDEVLGAASKAFQLADQDKYRDAVVALTGLKGVGPATASAILYFYSDAFPFMDDEVLECLHGSRTYTLIVYEKLREECITLGKRLGQDWTPRRVGRALWTAARLNATTGSNDFLQSSDNDTSHQKNDSHESKGRDDDDHHRQKRNTVHKDATKGHIARFKRAKPST